VSELEMTEEVAEKIAEAVPEFTRSMNKIKVQFGLIGVAIGTAVGATAAWAIAYRKAETKYSKIADDEIAEMRDHYREKATALEAEAAKRPVEEIVRERGYSSSNADTTAPPMAVQPPAAVRESEDEDSEPEVQNRNVFEEARVEYEWDYHEERRRRSPDIPYVIHYDELHEIEAYSEVSLTYYEGDDVLCNERDEIVDPDERNDLVGEKNLERFGHGSNDASIVYVRNDKLQIVYEVVKSPNSYAEEVHGFNHDANYRGNLERMRARERDETED